MTHKKLSARILSLVLTAAMVGTMMPTTVFATEGDIPLGVSSTRTITAFDELGEGYTKSVPFDGHTYAVTVKLGTPIEEIVLPTELGVTVEKTTTTTTPPDKTVAETPAADESEKSEPAAQTVDTDTTVSGNEPATPSDAEPAPAPEEKPDAEAPPVDEPEQDIPTEAVDTETTVTEVAQETTPVTWMSDRAYTPDQNSKVIYTAVLPEGYALADGAKPPLIYVMVGKQARAAQTVSTQSNLISAINGVTETITITLGDDIKWDRMDYLVIPETQTNDITIDLNGKTLTCKIQHGGSGALTIDDTSAGGKGVITNDTHNTLNNMAAGTINIVNGTVEASEANYAGCAIQNHSTGTINVSGGTVLCNKMGFPIYGTGTGPINISGGTVKALVRTAILIIRSGKITISEADGATTLITSPNSSYSKATIELGGDSIGGASALTNATLEITGGTVQNTGIGKVSAIWSGMGAKVIIGGDAKITSASTDATTGSICIYNIIPMAVPLIALEVLGNAVVENANGDGYAVYFEDSNVTDANVKKYYSVATSASVGRVYPESTASLITIGTQSTAVTYGTVTSPTYTVTASNFSPPAFAPSVEWIGTAPIGVTTTFSADNATLTVTTATNTKAGEYKFKVVSPKTGGGNYESNESVLTVDKRVLTVSWGRVYSFPYTGAVQAPYPNVSNDVPGDDIFFEISGGRRNRGSGYTATIIGLIGDDADNYDVTSAIGKTAPFSIY